MNCWWQKEIYGQHFQNYTPRKFARGRWDTLTPHISSARTEGVGNDNVVAEIKITTPFIMTMGMYSGSKLAKCYSANSVNNEQKTILTHNHHSWYTKNSPRVLQKIVLHGANLATWKSHAVGRSLRAWRTRLLNFKL